MRTSGQNYFTLSHLHSPSSHHEETLGYIRNHCYVVMLQSLAVWCGQDCTVAMTITNYENHREPSLGPVVKWYPWSILASNPCPSMSIARSPGTPRLRLISSGRTSGAGVAWEPTKKTWESAESLARVDLLCRVHMSPRTAWPRMDKLSFWFFLHRF